MKSTKGEGNFHPAKDREAPLSDLLRNKTWRLDNLYHCLDKGGHKVKFRLNWVQRAFLATLWYLNIILKARQLGFTTFIAIYMLDECLFHSNIKAVIIADTKDNAQEIFKTKIKFAYDNLSYWLKELRPLKSASKSQFEFANGSSIQVRLTARSGTCQLLHISEHGEICARFPEKAEEIRSGSLNSVQAGQMIFIESTAKGRSGDFYKYCKASQAIQEESGKLSQLDFKFHFYPWWKCPEYRLANARVTITQELSNYFDGLFQTNGINLDREQQAWYAKKFEQLLQDGNAMKQQYPSTPEEAFESAIQGAYYSNEMGLMRKEGRICDVHYEPSVPVNTFWDIGVSNATVVWFHQRVGLENRLIDLYHNNNVGLEHYVEVLQNKKYVYGRHYFPHDIEVTEWGTEQTRLERMIALGLRDYEVIPALSIGDGIEAVRSFLRSAYIDKTKCAMGIKALDEYRREWDDRLVCYRERPLHDWCSDFADALRYGALGFKPGQPRGEKRRRRPSALAV